MRSFICRLLVFCALPFVLSACGGGDEGTPAAWSVPDCKAVSGSRTIAFSANGGTNLVMPSQPPVGTGHEATYEIIPLTGIPDRILAYYNGISGHTDQHPPGIYRSDDAGCSWKRVAELQARGSRLVAGGGRRAIGWTDLPFESIVFVTDEKGRLARTTSFSAETISLVADAADPDRMRRLGFDFGVYESQDGGATWTLVAAAPASATGGLLLSAEFNESDVDWLAIGGKGLVVTHDGGVTWANGVFDSKPVDRTVIHSIAIGIDGQTVWASGLDRDDIDAGAPNQGRRLWQSTDRGLTFSTVAVQDATTKIVDQLHAHPANPNIVMWSGGVFGDPTTHLYRYSRTDGLVTRVELSDGTPFFDVGRFAFNPADPAYMYFGLVWPGPSNEP